MADKDEIVDPDKLDSWIDSLKLKKISEPMDKSLLPAPPTWIHSDKYVGYHRYLRLDFTPSLVVGNQMEFAEGDWFRLIVLDPWPMTSFVKNLIFEIPELKKEYIKMEKEMTDFYKFIDNRAPFPADKIEVGHHVVFYDKIGHELFIYKRAVVVGSVKRVPFGGTTGPRTMVPIRLIDGGHSFTADSADLLFLESQFAVLPPRVYNFVLDGMAAYKDLWLYDCLIRPESGLFDGILYVNLTNNMTKNIVVYSNQFPGHDYIYGLNGYALQRFASDFGEPKLPEEGEEQSDAYVVYATETAEVFLQLDTPFYRHYTQLYSYCTIEKINELKGKVKMPLTESVVLMAPHASSDGTYYRCTFTKQEAEETKIHVCFVDYGDTDIVNLEDVIYASDIHPALVLIPNLAVSAKLSKIERIDLQSFWEIVPREGSVVVFRCPDVPECKAQVELRLYCQFEGKMHRETVVSETEGKVSKKLELPEESVFCLPEETMFRRIPMEDQPFFENYGSHFYSPGRVFFMTIVSYNKDGSVWVHPTVLRERLAILEESMRLAYDKPWRGYSDIYLNSWKKGNCFMVYSTKFRKVIRCVLTKDVTKASVKESDIQVILVDYGCLESVGLTTLKVMKEDHCILHPAGCKAYLELNGKPQECSSQELNQLLNRGAIKGEIVSSWMTPGGFPVAKINVIRPMKDSDFKEEEYRPVKTKKSL